MFGSIFAYFLSFKEPLKKHHQETVYYITLTEHNLVILSYWWMQRFREQYIHMKLKECKL